MSELSAKPLTPDQAERERALDTTHSVLVQAPAGSGKTDLLTRRFLALLGEVGEPGQIVAITFTRAAAAEIRHRILSELEKAASADPSPEAADNFSMESLARRALVRSRALGWHLLDLQAQLRISTIDSFCRELAIQQPLVSGLGNNLNVMEKPDELYRRAARGTLTQIDGSDTVLAGAIQELLLWRDNNWSDLESLLVEMLKKRDQWMQGFVLGHEPDWTALRDRIEKPFANAIRETIGALNELLDLLPPARDEAMQLARFACSQSGGVLHRDLAELAGFPSGPCETPDSLEETRCALLCLADLVLTQEHTFRRQVNKTNGFPADRKPEKNRLLALIADLRNVDGLEAALAAVRSLPPARYTEEDWRIVCACFTLLRHAAAELRTAFATAGAVDFIEVAQSAQHILSGEDGLPSDAAIAVADGIRHLLIDEFQDTSRRQHHLLASLAAAWPDRTGRTIFVVGDPMQSIYFFRDADAELFPRVRNIGLDLPEGDRLAFDFVPLTANFRTQQSLIRDLNEVFDQVFAANDGSGVTFAPSKAARPSSASASPRLSLHCAFTPQSSRTEADASEQKQSIDEEREQSRKSQIDEIVAVIRSHLGGVAEARSRGEKYRIAVLARTRSALAPIAAALREAAIPFRAVELEQLKDRSEVLDAIALGRALLNPMDRVAWLGALRAPWCGLALDELHTLASADDYDLIRRPIPQLMRERISLLRNESRVAVERVLLAVDFAQKPTALPPATFGTWLEQAWLGLGGALCVDSTGLANLKLFWSCLDSLPHGAQDFLGPALHSALEALTAMPDSETSSESGVQLMTIHKSKGLEFEVVIVPELQAQGRRSRQKLLAWLERGLEEPDEFESVTEFLIAPLPTKGSESGQTRKWVERVYCERESQEMRRILYVAATRAREDLHFFARPEYKNEDSELSLVAPSNSLLATAWPAFERETRVQFDAWKSSNVALQQEAGVFDIAASGEDNLFVLPSVSKPTLLRRLPADFELPSIVNQNATAKSASSVEFIDVQLYARHEGGIASRALGSAVHKLLEELAGLLATHNWMDATSALTQTLPGIEAKIRATGIATAEAHSIAVRALEIAQKASNDPFGRWILSPRPTASSESAWTGVVTHALRSVRVDRTFRAGLEPLTEGDDALWIVDYKTAHADNIDPSIALPELRRIFSPQIEAYAAVLRNAQGAGTPLRASLYYPRMSAFDWWAIEG